MVGDLIKELRQGQTYSAHEAVDTTDVMEEAADEIERLQGIVDEHAEDSAEKEQWRIAWKYEVNQLKYFIAFHGIFDEYEEWRKTPNE